MGARCTFLAPPTHPHGMVPPPYPAVLAATVVVLELVLLRTSTSTT